MARSEIGTRPHSASLPQSNEDQLSYQDRSAAESDPQRDLTEWPNADPRLPYKRHRDHAGSRVGRVLTAMRWHDHRGANL
jgi:hypothetical protein